MRIEEQSPQGYTCPAPLGPALFLLGGHEAASEQLATEAPQPNITPRKLQRKRETVLRRKRRGQFLTGHRKRERKTLGKEASVSLPLPVNRDAMVPIPALPLPLRTGDQRGQMERKEPGGWAGPQGMPPPSPPSPSFSMHPGEKGSRVIFARFPTVWKVLSLKLRRVCGSHSQALAP